MESCPLVKSHILAELHPERATYTTLHNHFSLMDYPNLLKLLLLGLYNCLSTHSIHIVVWGNFPFKVLPIENIIKKLYI